MVRFVRKMEKLVGVGSRVPELIYKKIESEAKEQGVTRSAIIRHHLIRYYGLKVENERLKKRIEELRKEADTWRELYEKLKEENEELRNKVELYKMEIERLKDELRKPFWQRLKFW
ncbi:hypothetical protein VFC49_09250 [Thermococcus sp. SY098]|uniref:hypothetical protein n=1 Tax=Thermococcus sp. SY098 TaxID=3111325 RepID=UPI002D76B7BE|nr:hypothetical protein [Thermococcus sp. SY098]WRS52232.1 hypothetical protein VFC49_09250 [Thermococcus sp. SY098]